MSSQLGIAREYKDLYGPIFGAADGHGRDAVPTPHHQMTRAEGFEKEHTDLLETMTEAISEFDTRVIGPATTAREYIAPLRKTIQKRQNKGFDLEKCTDKVLKLQRKNGKTAKEDAALAKLQQEHAQLNEVCC